VKLELAHVAKSFGGLRAVSDVGFVLPPRAIFGLIGPNGAGKTTVFNLISGVYRADAGTIRFGDVELGRLAPAEVASRGVARTFQNIRLFAQLTALENLLVACERTRTTHLAGALLRSPAYHRDEARMRARAMDLLDVFGLADAAFAPSTSLPYGSQRRLEIARAMMLEPRLVLLDEPAAGMNHTEADALGAQIRWLRDTFDVSILVVEHNMRLVMEVCEAIHVLDHGVTIAHGTPAEIRADPRVIAAYLGQEDAPPRERGESGESGERGERDEVAP